MFFLVVNEEADSSDVVFAFISVGDKPSINIFLSLLALRFFPYFENKSPQFYKIVELQQHALAFSNTDNTKESNILRYHY